MDQASSFLLHKDFSEHNIRVKDNKITGIIDFGDVVAGPVEDEFWVMHVHHPDDEPFEAFLKGYGDVDRDKMNFYTFTNLVWLIPTSVGHKRRDHKVTGFIDLLRRIVY